MAIIYKFPDELVSNEAKLDFQFGQEYALAIWDEWGSRYYSNKHKLHKYRLYADGKQPIDSCKKSIQGKLIKDKHFNVDWEDRLNILPILLRNFYNSVDNNQFIPAVRAIDVHAAKVKNARKEQKLKNFYAKDFIQQTAQFNGGNPIIPLEDIPQSKEQIDLEEETANPLKKEIAEELVLSTIAKDNNFDIIKDFALKDGVEQVLYATRIDTDPIEGIKITYIKNEDLVYSKTNNPHFTDCTYFGEVTHITVGKLRNIAKRNGVKITDDDIREMVNLKPEEKVNNKILIKVLFYAFETFFTETKIANKKYSKKLGKYTGEIKLFKEEEFNPNNKNPENFEKVTDNYPVWLEGIMVLDGTKNTIIKHGKAFAMPEHKGKILCPYVVCQPRRVPFMEEIIPRIDSISILRYRMLNIRNNMKGNITRFDPDALAGVTLGNETLSPEDVLSMYWGQFIAFDKNTDEFFGDAINRKTPVSETPTSIPYALRELSQQFIQEIQLLQQTFGAVQYDQAKPDPLTQSHLELYRNSDNTAMRDYTKHLYKWIVRNYQLISARLNDIDTYPNLLQRYASELDTEDEDIKKFFLEERAKSRFEVYEEMIMTKEEKADFAALLNLHVQSGQLDALDVQILKNIRNPKVAASKLRLMLITKQKQQQEFELNKIKENQNQNVVAAQVGGEEKRKTLQLENELKTQRDKIKFEQDAFLLQKQGEMKIYEAQVNSQSKQQREEWNQNFMKDLTITKKNIDEETRLKAIDASAKNQEQLIKLRKGEIDSINSSQSQPQVDLTTLNQ